MNRKKEYRFVLVLLALLCMILTAEAQDISELRLMNYRPKSIYNIPKTYVEKAKYPAIDMHTHVYGRNDEEIVQWLKVMDACGIEKSIVFTGATGERFDDLLKMYSKYGDRFEVWCGFDYSGYDEPGYGHAAVKELERCFKAGARGVGEVMFKGQGVSPSSKIKSIMLPDDPRLDPLWNKCAELGMLVNLHISEDKWMYEKIDSTNDGLMNAAKWQVKMENGAKSHEEMLERFENTLKKYPETTFIAAHLSNCCADLSVLAGWFDKYPNLYADISARYAEVGPIPKYMHKFIEKYQDRIVYGTDVNFNEQFYRLTFRMLESADEHYYEPVMLKYHWPLYGMDLTDKTLKKVYRGNALKLMKKKK